MGGYKFEGVNTDRFGTYFYNFEDIPRASVPISDVSEGDFKLSKEQLKYWFDISDQSVPDLPKFLIRPRLDSRWGGGDYSWWNITGDMVVYKPKRWVPNISRTRTYPRSAIETVLKETTMTTTTTKLYAKAEASLEVPVVRASSGREGKLGDKVIHEVWVSMLLEVEEVYSHSLKFWVESVNGYNNIGWYGGPGWGDINVSSESLKDMDGLKFNPIAMSGGNHSDSIYVVTLPVFKGKGNDKEIESLHVALSCRGWRDWYAYVTGTQGPSHRTELMAWPSFPATPTLLAV